MDPVREALETAITDVAFDEADLLIAQGLTRGRYGQRAWAVNTCWVNAYKLRFGCMFCDETDPSCLDLHHRDAATKADEVGRMVALDRPLRLIIAEVRKCDVVCANCHRKTHYRERHKLPPLMPTSGRRHG